MDGEEGNPQTVDLAEALKQYKENKITKENVWSTHLIDDFQTAVENHHRSLGNFPLVGSVLEASSHLYGFKVDCVHNDVMCLSSGLRRRSIIQNLDESIPTESDHERSVAPRRVSKNRRRCTVTKNKDLINAKLDMIPEPDSLFKKSATTIAQLFQNILPSHSYALQLGSSPSTSACMNFNDSDYIIDGSDEAILNAESVEFPLNDLVPSSRDVLRPKLTGYRISDSPTENVWISAVTDTVNDSTAENSIDVNNDFDIDFRFDIDASVESITEPDLVISNIGDNRVVALTEDDQNALSRCSVLRRKRRLLSDMRPVVPSSLEYSYRPIVQQDQNWAGPAYWKFPTTKTSTQNRNTNRRQCEPRRTTKDEPVQFDANPEEIDNLFISTADPRVNSIRKCDTDAWNPRKYKLPTDLKLNKNRFSHLSFAPSLSIGHNGHNEENINVMDTNSDSDVDMNDVGTGEDLPDIGTGEDLPDVGPGEDIPNVGTGEDIPNVGTGEDIPNVGTGELVTDGDIDDFGIVDTSTVRPSFELPKQVLLPFASSTLNMKEFNKHSLEIITGHKDGDVTFSLLYHQLANIYGKEKLSPGIVFSSILELANQNKFHLVKIGENDFIIKKELP